MRILVLEGEASTRLGGAELSMFSYIDHLNRINHDVYLAYEKNVDWLNDENRHLFKESCRINSDSFRGQGIGSFLKNIKKFVKFAQKVQADIIFTHTIHSFLFLRIANLFIQKPVVVYFKWTYSRKSIGVLNNWGAKVIDKAIFLPAVESYWLSNGVKPRLGQMCLYNGIKFDFKGIENSNPVRGIKNLVFFGRIVEAKGLHLIIKALREIPSLSLFVYGMFDSEKDEYHSRLLEMIEDYQIGKRIKFMGFTKNPIKEMIKYDLVVIPSVWEEPQGRVLFEAMATKTLVLASNSGGMPAILGKAHKELLFQKNSESLAKRIKEISDWDYDKINSTKNQLYSRFISNYTENKTQKSLDQFLGLDSHKPAKT